MAFCTNCGKKIRENSNFCTQCGTKVRKSSQSSYRSRKPYKQPQNEQKISKPPSYKTPIVFQTKQPSSSNISNRKSDPEPINDEIALNETIDEPQESLDNKISTNRDLQSGSSSESQLESNDENDVDTSESQVIESKIEDSKENLLKEELKENLMRIKYSFKNLDESEPDLFKATFLAGSIKNLIWNFQKGFELNATLPENVNQKIIFSIELKENRPPYDWKNPYNNVIFDNEIDDERILKKIKREGRVIEKLSRIKGTVKTKVNGNNIIINVDSIYPNNIRPALDAIKEIAWLMDITLK
ncbi:MAG: hypothetical protein HeimC3_11800 [Candidatus Heimdallarchaeota archaeon LC_3]|nr:MAG: hypothetical protein HeimC3_11800 [Candidatus Heimdallarchaeota archaeon LC_3]